VTDNVNVFNKEGATTPEAIAAAQAAEVAAQAAAQAQSTPPVVPTIASEFVGEGKKYSSVEVALGSIPHSQAHIDNLEAENARLREAAEGSTKLDDALSRIEAGAEQTARPATPEYDPAKMREEARNVYQEIDQAVKIKANVAKANSDIYAMYGDKSVEVTKQVAQSLGVSVEFLESTAAQSPSAFMKLVTDHSSETDGSRLPTSIQPTINSDAINLGTNPDAPTAKVGKGGSTKELLAAWNGAKTIVANQN